MKDYELAKMSLSELLLPVVERMAQEEPQKLAKMIPPEQLMKALTPEQVVSMLPPEQLAKILTREQLAKTLEAALPPDVWEQIKQRLH
ncbi:MAG TPA: hypothetical protein VE093_19780 [Polyangiaceae bacterium]|jgi:hypothetical protein|nr:hypothetical protein [Polyangiaceae bacterium]